jgi:hypothetical protein
MPVKLGPGTLTIGETGTEVDASCLVNNAKITMTKDEADSTTKLCGDVVPGAITYTYVLEGNVDIDPSDPTGLFQLCDTHKGESYPFTFVPNTVDGTQATGTVILDPLDFGADEYGADMTSDFSFTMVGDPTYAPVPPVGDTGARTVTDVSGDVSDELLGGPDGDAGTGRGRHLVDA